MSFGFVPLLVIIASGIGKSSLQTFCYASPQCVGASVLCCCVQLLNVLANVLVNCIVYMFPYGCASLLVCLGYVLAYDLLGASFDGILPGSGERGGFSVASNLDRFVVCVDNDLKPSVNLVMI